MKISQGPYTESNPLPSGLLRRALTNCTAAYPQLLVLFSRTFTYTRHNCIPETYQQYRSVFRFVFAVTSSVIN